MALVVVVSLLSAKFRHFDFYRPSVGAITVSNCHRIAPLSLFPADDYDDIFKWFMGVILG